MCYAVVLRLKTYGLRLSRRYRCMSWFGVGSRGSAIPTPQSLLRSVYVGRVCVAAAIYLARGLKFAVAAPLDLLVTPFVLVATVVAASGSCWHTRLRRRAPGPALRD